MAKGAAILTYYTDLRSITPAKKHASIQTGGEERNGKYVLDVIVSLKLHGPMKFYPPLLLRPPSKNLYIRTLYTIQPSHRPNKIPSMT